MKTTFEYIQLYLEEYYKEYTYKNLTLSNYTLNGSIIKIRYGYTAGEERYEYWSDDNIIDIELLDYITWMVNRKV